jgi:hypothetical protein
MENLISSWLPTHESIIVPVVSMGTELELSPYTKEIHWGYVRRKMLRNLFGPKGEEVKKGHEKSA